jgi:hypothetical protein
MRNFNLLLLLVCLFLLSSCCHKKDCEEWIDNFELKNFTEQDADSIILKSYQKSSNFTMLSDSIFTSGVYPTDFPGKLIIYLQHNFNDELEYKIEVLSIGKTYSITGFDKKKAECNSCFPWGHTYYLLLDKYYVNGTEKHSDGNGIIIDK